MKLIRLVFEHHIVRYIFSGGTAAFVNLVLLYILTDMAGMHYLLSGVISFSCAVVVSFIMQKKWTFQDHSTHATEIKFAVFLTIAVVNLFANTLLLYIFTDLLNFYYMFSQILAGAIVAIWSYLIYKKIFRQIVPIDITG